MNVKVLVSFSDLRLNGGKTLKVGQVIPVQLSNIETKAKTEEAIASLVKAGLLEVVKDTKKK